MIDYVEGHSPYRMMLLTGYAGTGKTFTSGRLQDWLLYAKKLKVACSAPTNKAVQVCKDLCDIADVNLVFSTIHKLLGLKEQYDYHGRLKFVPDPMNPPSLEGFNVLIIDESSMFDDDLFRLINPFIEQGLKIIFIGDPAQIPPVNRNDCIPFQSRYQAQYKIGVVELRTIMRQANENPLLNFATQIREQRTQDNFDYPYEMNLKDDMGIIPIRREARDVIYRICDVYFANPIFAEYPDFMKVIAWRNVTVDAVNSVIRKLIYKQGTLPLLMPGEKMIADQPIKTLEKNTLTTNSEFKVLDYTIKSTRLVGKVGEDVVVRNDFKYYETSIETMTDRGLRTYTLMILHEDELKKYNTDVEQLRIYAAQKQGPQRSDAWKAYYNYLNAFAKVKYNYAITAHKAQGSSYENCMMIEWDMYQNTRFHERNRIRYVAATRARKKLFIVK